MGGSRVSAEPYVGTLSNAGNRCIIILVLSEDFVIHRAWTKDMPTTLIVESAKYCRIVVHPHPIFSVIDSLSAILRVICEPYLTNKSLFAHSTFSHSIALTRIGSHGQVDLTT